MASVLLILPLLFFTSIASNTLVTTGTTVTVNGVSYYLPGSPVASLAAGSLPSTLRGTGLMPVTVVNSTDVATATAGFSSDDVWQPGFLEGNVYFFYGFAS